MDFIFEVFSGFLSILLTLLSFAIPQVRDFFVKKFQHSLDKALENQKALNDRKNYISKVRFDKEFEIYQELSEKNLTMVYDCGTAVCIVRGMYEKGSSESTAHLEKLCNDLNDAEMATKKYAPFIDEKICNEYQELQDKATYIFKLFNFWNSKTEGNYRIKNSHFSSDTILSSIEKFQKELSDLSTNILNNLRNYLKNIDVEEYNH